MPLTAVQKRVDCWSKVVLVVSTVLLLWSAGLFLMSAHSNEQGHFRHHREGSVEPQSHHHRHRHHHACPLHHFATLGLVTALTGMFASFSNRRAAVSCFILLVLAMEVMALVGMGHANAKAIQMCQATSVETVGVVVEQAQGVTAGGQRVAVRAVVPVVQQDGARLDECLEGVRQAAITAALVIGTIACSVACCASRHSRALAEAEAEDAFDAAVAAEAARTAVVVELTSHKELPELVVVDGSVAAADEWEKVPLKSM